MTFRSARPRNTAATLVRCQSRRTGRSSAARLRRRARAGRSVVPPGDGVERRRGARDRGVVRGAPPHAEGARDRAAGRAPSRRRRLPAPDRGRARRARALGARALAVRREGRDRAGGAHVRRRPSARAARRHPDRDFGVAAVRGARRTRRPERDRRRRARALYASAPVRRASAARSTTASCPRRPGSSARRSTSRRAAIRARSRSRASTTAVA